MRVLIVTNTYPPDISGVGSLVQELARQLYESEEHSVTVLARTSKSSDPWVVSVGCSKARFPFCAAWAFLRLEEGSSYDLIHVHESDGALLVWSWRLVRLFGLARGRASLVATLQVTYSQERRKVRDVWALGRRVSRPTRDERKFARVKARVHSFLGWTVVRSADRIVAPSAVTAGELREDYGARLVDVIYNGIDIEPIPKADPGGPAEDDPVKVLYMGRLRTRKAVAVLLHAFVDVVERCPRARLLIVGDGEQFEKLEKLRRQLELDDRVEILGGLGRNEALKAYADAHIYCLPSLYEGFPVATLEAMAAGLPVVSTTVSGIPEQVEHGETGLLVPPEDAGALSEALCRLVRDPELRRRMGEAGRRRVEEEFTIERIAKDYLELWHNLLDGSN